MTHSSGNLTPTYSPLNWDKFNILFKRSKDYHSILRKQIIDSEFPFDGKAYIDDIYANYGIDTDIGCEIQYLNKSTMAYATLLDGLIDLSEWTKLRDTTSVKIIDNSNLSKFIARDKIAVPINRSDDLDGDSISSYTYLNNFTVGGVDIEEKAQWIDITNSIPVTTAQASNFSLYYGITADAYEFNTIGVDAVLPPVVLTGPSGVIYTNNTGSTQTIRYRIITSVDGNVSVTASGPWSWAFQVWVGKNGATNPIFVSASGSGNDSRPVSGSYDPGYLEATLANGDTLKLYHRWYGSTGGDTITPNFTIEPIHVEVSTLISGQVAGSYEMPLVHEIGARLLEIITGQSDPLNSPLLGRTDSEPRTYGSDGDYSLMGIASGLVLRGFPFSEKPIKTTFKDYFKSIDAVANLGLWYDESNSEFQIKAKEEFYRTDKIITLGEVQDLEISIATDEYFNEILTGYAKDVDYEEANGQQVPNVPASFTNSTQRIQNNLDIRSKYRADDYGIELSRQQKYSETAGEDTRYDNDIFMLWGRRQSGSFRTEQGDDNFMTITGVYSPGTRLNLDITPKRNMLRHANRLSIPLFISNGDTNFMQSQFDLGLSTTKSGDPAVAEKDDLAYADLEQPIYHPEIYNFNSKLTIEIILQLVSDPHGYVEFDYLGVTYSGYILEVSSEPFNRRGNCTLIKRNPNRT